MYHFFRALAKNSSFIFFSCGFLRLEKNTCSVCAVGFFSSNVEFSTIFCIMHNVLHIAVRAGFSVENSKRAAMFKFMNKFQTEALCPPDGNMFVTCSFFLKH